MRTAVIIPTLNEVESIAIVIGEVLSHGNATVFVVDNASTDGTAEVARNAGAIVVNEPRRGYGYACAAGVAAAGEEFDVVAFMDGDGSDDGRQLGTLLDPIENDLADLALGSRTSDASDADAVLPHQRLGNALITQMVWLLYGQKLTDIPPFKAIRRPVLNSLNMSEMTYGWTVEMIVKCAKRRYRLVERPVASRHRLGGRSKVSGTVKGTLLAAYYLVGTTVKYALRE
jgi:glycosyltransferase involved in cell wall biosynthesis